MPDRNLYNRLESHLEFAAGKIKSHQWPQDTEYTLKKSLDSIRSRLQSPCVNISVVGGFSAGKSSFINALLEVNILETDEMPDTTLVPAVMFYSPVPVFQILRCDGSGAKEELTVAGIRRRLKEFSIPELKIEDFPSSEDYFKKYSEYREKADQIASEIIRFNIGIPSPFLKEGFRLIDTPGLESGNERCAQIAKSFMQHTDASIIVSDATRGVLQESLRKQFSNFIGPKLEHCMVVFTRFDRTTPSRREKLRMYLESSTRAYFHLSPEQMPVFMAVPPTVVAELEGQEFGTEHKEMLALTKRSLTSLKNIASERREIIIARAIKNLFEIIYSNLERHVSEVQNVCLQKLKELRKSRSCSLESFIAEKLDHYNLVLAASSLSIRQSLETKLDKELEEIKKNCDVEVFKQPTTKALRNYLKNGLSKFMLAQTDRIKLIVDSSCLDFSKVLEDSLNDFEIQLQREFAKLKIIPVKISINTDSVTSVNTGLENSMKDSIKFAEAQINQDNREILGAVIGGIVGSVVTLGFGTMVGAILGSVFFSGGDTRSGITGARKRVKPKYEEEMKKNIDLIKQRQINLFSTRVNDAVSSFKSHLFQYNSRYKSEIDRMIKEEVDKRNALAAVFQNLETELVDINNHKKDIEKIC